MPTGFVVDPLDPRAPPSDVWAKLTPEERERVVSMLPPMSHKDALERHLAAERAALEEEHAAREAERAAHEAERAAMRCLRPLVSTAR